MPIPRARDLNVRAGIMGEQLIRRLCAIVLLGASVAGCDAIGSEPKAITYVPQGGVHAYSRTLSLNDVWLDAPSGVPRGGAADLRLSVINNSRRLDALTGVTTPLAQDDQLRLDGHPAGQIVLPPGQDVNMEWNDRSGVWLTGFRRPLRPASWMRISLHFAHSETITMQVIAGPLATPRRTSAPWYPRR